MENKRLSQVTAKPDDKLKDVVNTFKFKESSVELRNSLFDYSFHDIKVDKNKTLKELGVTYGDSILLIETEKFIFTDYEKKTIRKIEKRF